MIFYCTLVQVSKEQKRDPRFDPLCGEFDKNLFRSITFNYEHFYTIEKCYQLKNRKTSVYFYCFDGFRWVNVKPLYFRRSYKFLSKIKESELGVLKSKLKVGPDTDIHIDDRLLVSFSLS